MPQKTKVDKETALALYEGMLRTNIFEEALHLLYRQGELIGGLYTGEGNEAVAVGSSMTLRDGDTIAPSHRCIGAHFVRGETMLGMLLQIMARRDGATKGRDNSAHQGSMDRGVLGLISHLAAMPGLAAGCALAHKIKKNTSVSMAYVGDGGTSLGDFHETLNIAAVMKLPFIMIIENNQWAYSTPTDLQYCCEQLSDRAQGYGIPGITIDGTDIEEVYTTVLEAVERARKGEGATLIETITMRLKGHSAADMAEYVPKDTIKDWEEKHPLARYRETLRKRKWLSKKTEETLEAQLRAELETAIEQARANPLPEPWTAAEGVYAS